MDIFSGIASVLVGIAIYALPLFVLGWFVRSVALMRRDQQRLIGLIESIEAELRAMANRERWGRG